MTTQICPEIIGKTVKSISGLKQGSECVIFWFTDSSVARMFHSQECCEDVYLEDFDNDESIFDNAKILDLTVIHRKAQVREQDSATWTFYKMKTSKGHITFRWFGESNGYYSEEACFEYISAEEIEESKKIELEIYYKDKNNREYTEIIITTSYPSTSSQVKTLLGKEDIVVLYWGKSNK